MRLADLDLHFECVYGSACPLILTVRRNRIFPNARFFLSYQFDTPCVGVPSPPTIAIADKRNLARFLAVTIATAWAMMNRANVFAEQKIQSPVKGHADLFVQPWQFAQVNRAPQPPGEKAGEIESENPRYAGSTAN